MTAVVRKQTVEQFIIEHEGERIVLEREDAVLLYGQLARALTLPVLKHGKCGDRYSHGPHFYGEAKGEASFCTGRSFDAT